MSDNEPIIELKNQIEKRFDALQLLLSNTQNTVIEIEDTISALVERNLLNSETVEKARKYDALLEKARNRTRKEKENRIQKLRRGKL
ncbi:MAG: hypothetical protein ACTSW1_15595 [Candidatus Hodarchaeales archaeon]